MPGSCHHPVAVMWHCDTRSFDCALERYDKGTRASRRLECTALVATPSRKDIRSSCDTTGIQRWKVVSVTNLDDWHEI